MTKLLPKKNRPKKIQRGLEQKKDFLKIEQMLNAGPCLAHYAKDKGNIVTVASTNGLGITQSQKQDG